VLDQASIPLGPPPAPSRFNLTAIREALDLWGVTTIVIPDEPDLPLYAQGRSAAYAVGLLTAAMGRPPAYDHSAWVWSAVAVKGPAYSVTQTGFNACVTGTASRVSSRLAVPSCIAGSAG
jgi:hypothetical protein